MLRLTCCNSASETPEPASVLNTCAIVLASARSTIGAPPGRQGPEAWEPGVSASARAETSGSPEHALPASGLDRPCHKVCLAPKRAEMSLPLHQEAFGAKHQKHRTLLGQHPSMPHDTHVHWPGMKTCWRSAQKPTNHLHAITCLQAPTTLIEPPTIMQNVEGANR